MKGRTCLVIAHHLDTIRRADVIFVVKDAAIVEQGTHDSLLAAGGVYHDLYEMQTNPRSSVTEPLDTDQPFSADLSVQTAL